jgi:hypothetical protein
MKPPTQNCWEVRLLALVLMTSMLGCATAPSNTKMLRPEDLKSLAGKWQGPLNGSGWSFPIVYTFNADGTYSSEYGSNTSRGVLRIVDGALRGERREVSGSIAVTGTSEWTATLSERDGRRMLTGQGRANPGGPYNFEITEQK